jgi:cyclophilin family peptidyl-prolyl cis-trans isomerase
MARAELDSGGSQWFVTTGEQPHLAGLYTQFGQVVLGGYVPERLTVGDRILSVRIEEVVQ